MSEGRELGGPHGSGGPPRRGVYLVRRLAVGLALLILMVLIAPQAYQALVGSNSGTQAPPPEAGSAENAGAEKPAAEPAPPAEAPQEPTVEPAPEEPAEKDTAAKPPEDSPKDEKPAPKEEPTPPEAEEAAAAVLVFEEQYSSAAQYDAESPAAVEQYGVTEQYLPADQALPALPETVAPEAVVSAPADVAVQDAQILAEDPSLAALAPVPAAVEPVAVEPFPIEPVAVEPVAFETQYAPAAAPVAFETQYAPAVAPVATDEFAVPAAAPVVDEVPVPQAYSATGAVDPVTMGSEVVDEYQLGEGAANAVAYSSAG